jgi:hypothetical protein
VLEGSLDGSNWTEIDRQTEIDRPMHEYVVSFVVSKPAESRFIRLTQTAKSRGKEKWGLDCLRLCAVEFFGTLSE